MKNLKIILVTVFFFSFCNLSLSQTEKIDSLWNRMAYAKGGCLTGGQYIKNGVFGNRNCVMSENNDWKIFFQYPEKELTNFLIIQMQDTSTTRIHTCPFFLSTNGELAVYCLQKIYNKNWYDFKEFSQYKEKEITGSEDNSQAWLQNILLNKKQRIILKNLWLKELKNSK